MPGGDHPDTLNTQHKLAHILANSRQYREAEELCRSVFADRQRVLGHEHPDTLSTRHELARVIGLQGRYGEAEQFYGQVLTSRLRVLGNDHLETSTTHRELAQITSLHHPATGDKSGHPNIYAEPERLAAPASEIDQEVDPGPVRPRRHRILPVLRRDPPVKREPQAPAAVHPSLRRPRLSAHAASTSAPLPAPDPLPAIPAGTTGDTCRCGRTAPGLLLPGYRSRTQANISPPPHRRDRQRPARADRARRAAARSTPPIVVSRTGTEASAGQWEVVGGRQGMMTTAPSMQPKADS